MSFLATPEENKDYLQGGPEPGAPVPVSSVAQAPPAQQSPGGAGIGPNPSGGALTSPGTASAPQPFGGDFQRTGSIQDRLINPISSGLETGSEQLFGLSQDFYGQAGPSRTFEGIGGESLLDTSLAAGGNLDTARGLLGSTYEGPAGFDAQSTANLNAGLETLGQRAEALGTGAGLTTTIQRSAPGITRGGAREEAKRYIQDKDIRQTSSMLSNQVEQQKFQAQQQAQQASQFAQQRQEEERDIAEKARSGLLGRREQSLSGIDEQIAAHNQQRAQAADQYWDFLGSGDVGALGGQLAPDTFTTANDGRDAAAQARWEEIMAKYPNLADVPAMDIGTYYRGQELNFLPEEFLRSQGVELGENPTATDLKRATKAWYRDAGAGFDKYARRDAGYLNPNSRLTQRQRELEAAFSPGSARAGGGGFGEFAAEMPLYYGSGVNVAGPDVRNYVRFDPGVEANLSNASTDEQRMAYNRIQDVLGEAGRISAGSPLRAADMLADVEGFVQAQESALAQRTGELTQAASEWRAQVRRIRKDYKKLKDEIELGQVGRFIGDNFQHMLGHPIPPGAAMMQIEGDKASKKLKKSRAKTTATATR